MSDTITVSGGGTTRVETSTMTAMAAQLEDAVAAGTTWSSSILIELADTTDIPWTVTNGLESVAHASGRVAEDSRRLADLLGQAAEAYGAREAVVESVLGAAAEAVAVSIGVRLRALLPGAVLSGLALVPVGLMIALAVGGATLGGLRVGPEVFGGGATRRGGAGGAGGGAGGGAPTKGVGPRASADPPASGAPQALRELLSNPAAIRTIGLAISGADDLVSAATGVPSSVVGSLAGAHTSDSGVASMAAAVSGVAGLAGLTAAGSVGEAARMSGSAGPTPSRSLADSYLATRVRPETQAPRGGVIGALPLPATTEGARVAPPSDFGDLASRVPKASADGPQIRIETYGERSIVYVGGTADMGMNGGEEAFDLDSAVDAVSGRQSDSVDATRAAMQAAGIEPGSPVLLVGHSQGGIVAATIASQGEYDVSGVVALGAPLGSLDLADGVPVLSFEHTDDLVPRLAGPRASVGEEPDLLVVSREALGGLVPVDGPLLPAHELEQYRETAALADSDESARLVRMRDALLPSGEGVGAAGDGESNLWRVERRADAASAGNGPISSSGRAPEAAR